MAGDAPPGPGSLVLLGGTFDPVHNAHLQLARRALQALDPEKLLWLPTGSPGYRSPPVAPAADRVAMLRLAIAGEPRYAIDERELAPGHSGYTVDTLRALRAELGPERALVLLLGADQYARLGSWRAPQEVARLCRIVVAARPGWPVGAGATVLPFAPLAVSASDIRARLARGEDVSALVPPAVLAYIVQKGLYRT